MAICPQVAFGQAVPIQETNGPIRVTISGCSAAGAVAYCREKTFAPSGLEEDFLMLGIALLGSTALEACFAIGFSMRDSLRAFAQSGAPIYAECGGFMYLTEAIVDQGGRQYEMCGIFPTGARMQHRLAALGYTELEVVGQDSWLPRGQVMRGHEFRYLAIDEMPSRVPRLYRVHRAPQESIDGFPTQMLFASYFHVHFGSSPGFQARWSVPPESGTD